MVEGLPEGLVAYETDAEVAAEGVRAKLLLEKLRPKLDARLRQAINEMIAEFRGGEMSHARALSFIGAIAEITGLRESFEYEIRHGETAATRLHSTAKED